MVSPSQPNPSTIQMMWTSSTPVLVAMLYLLDRCSLVALLRKAYYKVMQLYQLQLTEGTLKKQSKGAAKGQLPSH
jgi:hypothetical protein